MYVQNSILCRSYELFNFLCFSSKFPAFLDHVFLQSRLTSPLLLYVPSRTLQIGFKFVPFSPSNSRVREVIQQDSSGNAHHYALFTHSLVSSLFTSSWQPQRPHPQPPRPRHPIPSSLPRLTVAQGSRSLLNFPTTTPPRPSRLVPLYLLHCPQRP